MKLCDASWIAPLLTAVAAGETLQCQDKAGTWWDSGDRADWDFSLGRDRYRIKPKVHEYRLYKYKNDEGGSVYNTERNGRREHMAASIEEKVAEGTCVWLGQWTAVPEEVKE